MIIHDKKRYEILVEQYNKDMLKDKCYSLVARHEDGVMEFLAKIDFVNGTKKFKHSKMKNLSKSGVEKLKHILKTLNAIC